MLQPTSTNPTLGTAVLTNSNSEVTVTSTTLDQPMLEITSPNGSKSAVVSSVINNDIYTLTLTDGSIVQLRVTNDPQMTQPTVVAQPSPENLATLENVTDHTWLSSENFDSAPIVLTPKDNPAGQRSSSVSPASFAEEVTLPFSNTRHNSADTPLPNTAADLLSPASPCSSAVSPREVFPYIQTHNMAKRPRRKATSKKSDTFTRSFSVCSEDAFSASNDASDSENDNEILDQESLFSMFSSMEKVTIERLKAKLNNLPDGQCDLGALLVAAKIDLTVEDIVRPPLTAVKKIMEGKGLSEWQMTLCLKIRRRKKNTVRLSFTIINETHCVKMDFYPEKKEQQFRA